MDSLISVEGLGVANSRMSTRTGGLIVAEIVQLSNVSALARCAGLAFATASITARAFSSICVGVNEALPTGTCMLPALSILNSTRPALTSFTALAVSSVTVPVFGFGIRPRGPSTLPSLRTSAMASGVATATSKSVQPSWHFLIMSSKPTYSAPAALAASAAGPLLANTSTRTVLPLPCGSGTVPRTIWSDCFGSTPRRKARSTVSLNLALGNLARTSTAALSGYAFVAYPPVPALFCIVCWAFYLLRCIASFGSPAVV